MGVQDFRAAAGARSKKFYQSRTEVAIAMGLQPVPIPEVPKEPRKRKAMEQTGPTAARRPCAIATRAPNLRCIPF